MFHNIVKVIGAGLMFTCLTQCKQTSDKQFIIPKEKLQTFILNEFEDRLSKLYSNKEVCIFEEVVKNHLDKSFDHPSKYDNLVIYHFSCYPYLNLKFHLLSNQSNIKYLIFETTLNDSITDTKKFIMLSKEDSIRLLNVTQSDEINLIESFLNNNYPLISNNEKKVSDEDILNFPKALIYEIYKEQYLTWTAISTFTVIRSGSEFVDCLLDLKINRNTPSDIQLINEFIINNQLYNDQMLILYNKHNGFLLFKINYQKEQNKVRYNIKKFIIYNSNAKADLWNDINNSSLKKCSNIN